MESVCHQLGPHILHDIVNKYRVLYRCCCRKEVESESLSAESFQRQPRPMALTGKLPHQFYPAGLRPLRTERTRSSLCIKILRRVLFWRTRKINAHHQLSDFRGKTCLTSAVPQSVSVVRSASGLQNAVLGLSNTSAPHLDFNTSALVVSGCWIEQLFRVVVMVELNTGK